MTDMSDKPGFRPPPPLVFLALILLGHAADRLFGLPAIPVDRVLTWAGFGAMAAGAAVTVLSLGLFGADHENPEPNTRTRRLVARGPYRYSRNPIYLAMAAIQAGYALWSASMGVLFMLPIVIALVDRLVIRKEEQKLTARFGKEYQDYCQRVRRWF